MSARSVRVRMDIELFPTPPYDFDRVLTWLPNTPLLVLGSLTADEVYRRAVSIGDKVVLFSVRSLGTVDAPCLLVEIEGDGADEEVAAEVIRLIRQIFCLDADLASLRDLSRRDPVVESLLRRFEGTRPLILADPYEALLWAIIGQQINTAFARKLNHTLVALCGRHLCLGEWTYPLLPRPEEVASLDADLLRANQFSRQKIASLIGISQAIADGELDLEALRPQPPEQAISTLTRYKGIGRWTAELVLLRGFGDFSIVPAGDLVLRVMIGQAYEMGRAASEQEVRDLAASWGEWRGWLTLYWWLASHSKAEE